MQISFNDGWASGVFSEPSTSYARIGSTRKFGVELEFDDLPNDAMDIEGSTLFGAKEDGSVDGGEFDSPILYGDDGLTECERFCNIACDNDFKVGRNCGFHLHCDVPDEGVERFKRIALAYHYTYDFWRGTSHINDSRDIYCESHLWTPKSLEESGESQDTVKRWTTGFSRYAWFNVASYNRFSTVEIRVHEGTRAKTDVVNWVIAHARFIDAVSELTVGQITRIFNDRKKTSTKFKEIRVMLANPEVSEHLKRRYELNHASN